MANRIIEDFRAARSRVNNLAAQGKISDAISLLRRLIQTNPQDQTLVQQAALLLARAKRSPEIIELLGNRPLDQLDGRTRHLLGSAYFEMRHYAKAADSYAGLKPQNDDVIKLRARALLMAGLYDEGEALLTAHPRRDQKMAGVVRYWMSEAEKLQAHETARRMQVIVEKLEGIEGIRKKQKKPPPVKVSPVKRPDASERAAYAEWLLHQGTVAKTYDALDQVSMAARTGGHHKVKAIIDLANDLRHERKYGAAIRVLARGRLALPDDPVLARMHGEILLLTGHVHQAVAILQRGLALAPADPVTLNLLANGFEQSGKPAEAISLLRRGHQDHPSDMSITASLGRILANNGGHVEAIGILQTALNTYPHHPRLVSALGGIMIEQGDYDNFDRLIETLPEKAARNSLVLRVRAFSKFRRHENEVARRLLEPVVLQQKGVTAVTILYVACADKNDATLQRLKNHLGGNAFDRAVMRAKALVPDQNLRTAVDARYNSPVSPVMRGGYLSPVNRAAVREMYGQEYKPKG